MSFKDEYKKSYDSIVPDKEFLEQLSEKMEEEKQKKQKVYYRPLAAIAGVILVLFVGLTAFHLLGDNSKPSKPIHVKTGNTLQTPSSEIGTFATPKWYDENDKPEKILSDFSKRLGNRKQLKNLYQNTENNFTDEMLVTEEDVHFLVDKLQTAKAVSESPELENKVYYMAEFQNGDIIKFFISDNRYFAFLDLEFIYQFED